MSNKVKVTFVLPANLQQDLKKQLVQEGYHLKGKSQWITEAIEQLFSMNSYVDLVKLNDEMKGFTKVESIVVARTFKKQLEEAVIQVRLKYPSLEGVQSRILRTAIVQRLL